MGPSAGVPTSGTRPLQPTLATNEPLPNIDPRYQLRSRIATGGMGEVWEAMHVSLGRPMAIKFLTHDEGGPRFLREAQAIAAIDHEGVVDVLDFGEADDGRPYFVMELVRGQPLDQLIHRQGSPLPWPSVRRIGLEISDALVYAHAAGVIHRDLKPSNVLLLDPPPLRGSSTKLIDFGIAKILDANKPKLTKTGTIQGTPAYMSPEQILGDEVDGRTDVYGLGCLLYFLLTGRKPFDGAAGTQALYHQIHNMPPRFAEVVPGLPIPAALEAIVFRALAKDKNARFESMAAMQHALASVPVDTQASESVIGPSFAHDSMRDGTNAVELAANLRAEALANKPKTSADTTTVNVLIVAVVLLLAALATLAWFTLT
nr:serine/threonine-protein kinase [Pseudenhygromyxa sp. WMMC2535]